MVSTNEIIGIQDAIEAEPYDPTLRRIYADMLEDRGGEEARAAHYQRAKADMMDGTWKPGKKALAWLKRVKAALNYRGRQAKWKCVGKLFAHGLDWGGGSRNTYTNFNPAGHVVYRTVSRSDRWVDVLPGDIWVERCVHCGKDCGLTVYVSVEAAYHLIDGESEE